LLVLMTHARSAPQRWIRGSVAEAAARRAHAPTLFLREDQRGFVDRKTGAISLQTILLPIDGSVPYQDACQRVAAFERLAASIARIHPLHVGTSAPANASEFGEQSFEGRRENLSQANKLSRTYAALIDALNRHRGKGQQTVRVEHVTVQAGGQAIVGNVETPGGGDRLKSEEQPQAIAYAPGIEMPSPR
jgi:hypothetical protein